MNGATTTPQMSEGAYAKAHFKSGRSRNTSQRAFNATNSKNPYTTNAAARRSLMKIQRAPTAIKDLFATWIIHDLNVSVHVIQRVI
jgi:hypothetical protein